MLEMLPKSPTDCAQSAHLAGVSAMEALEDLRRVLPGARPNELFMRVLKNCGDWREVTQT